MVLLFDPSLKDKKPAWLDDELSKETSGAPKVASTITLGSLADICKCAEADGYIRAS